MRQSRTNWGWLAWLTIAAGGTSQVAACHADAVRDEESVATVQSPVAQLDPADWLRDESEEEGGSLAGSIDGHPISMTSLDIIDTSGVQSAEIAKKADEALPSALAPKQASLTKHRLLAMVADTPDDSLVSVVIRIPDAPFAWRRLRAGSLAGATREAALSLRRSQMQQVTQPLRAKLTAAGAQNIQTFVATAAVFAEVPKSALAHIAAWPGVIDVAGDRQLTPTGELQYTGNEVRAGLRVNALESRGFYGNNGARVDPSTPVRVGIFDDFGTLYYQHAGFKRYGCMDYLGVPVCGFFASMFQKMWKCPGYSSTCLEGTPTADNYGHGTVMAGLINGTVEAGQDPAVTSFLERRQHSGVIPQGGARLYYYGVDGLSAGAPRGWSFALAVDRAILDGVDVVDLSQNYSGYPTDSPAWSSGCCLPCDTICDCGGMNGAIRNAIRAGVLIVKSAGNGGGRFPGTYNDECRVTYPGARPEVLRVGGLNSSSDSMSYASVSSWSDGANDGSAVGGMGIGMGGGLYSRVVSGIDLAAPSALDYEYSTSGGYYDAQTGTSQAAAIVTGATALFRQAAYANARNLSGYDLLTNMLLMGDGFSGYQSLNQAVPNVVSGGGFDWMTGAGRTRLHYPSNDDMGPSWTWGNYSGSVASGQNGPVISLFPISVPAGVTQIKAVMTVDEADLNNASDLDLYVFNKCTGSGSGAVIASDVSRDLRSRVVLAPSQSTYPLSCWGLQVRAYYVPPGESRTYRLAWYWHTQDPSQY